jgi:hypothetical protein
MGHCVGRVEIVFLCVRADMAALVASALARRSVDVGVLEIFVAVHACVRGRNGVDRFEFLRVEYVFSG